MSAYILACGDAISRTVTKEVPDPANSSTTITVAVSEIVILPTINMSHLTEITVHRGAVDGFHILPISAPQITAVTPFVLPNGTVRIVDSLTGNEILGAIVTVIPTLAPQNNMDMIHATVRVDHPGNPTPLATTFGKTIYPQTWTPDQIKQAIYSAYATQFQLGGPVTGLRIVGITPEGVAIEMRVNGSTTATGTTLHNIPTAYPKAGQLLDGSNVPS